jgi:hypothetical protein
MADVIAVRATITKIVAGYSVGMVIWARGRSRHLANKTAARLPEAEAVTESFAAQNRIPWHAVEVLYRCSIRTICKEKKRFGRSHTKREVAILTLSTRSTGGDFDCLRTSSK